MTTPSLPSERSFGLLFTAVFAAAALYGLLKQWPGWVAGLLFGAAIFLGLATLLAPAILGPFNRAWFQLGLLLGKIVSPIVLGVIFFGLLTPVALLARLAGRDELKLKRREQSSYWLERTPPGPTADSFKNQF